VSDYIDVVAGYDVLAPGSYPDIYSRTNRFAARQVSPAAGADISITVPNGVLWDVNSLTALFTAGAGVANRLVAFVVKNQDGQIVYQYQMATALTANQTCTFTFSEDFNSTPPAQGNGLNLLCPAPKPWFLPGWSFGTVTAAIAAADQWSAVTCWVEEYLPISSE
jgi:hypothetical protein